MDELRKANYTLPFIALTASVFLWGSTFAGTRIALRTLDPMIILWIRMAAANLVTLPFAGKLVPGNYRKGDWKYLIPMMLFQPCLYFLLESNALRFTTSSQAGVVAASVPLLVALGAWMFLKEKIGTGTVMGMMLSILGVAVLTFSQKAGSQASNPLLGNTLEFLAMICAAGNILIIKKLSNRYSAWTLTAMQNLTGLFFFSPGLYKIIQNEGITWTPGVLALVVYMGIFASLVAFGLYNWGMSHLPASKASSFINLVPVTAIIFGWTILGEGLNPIQIAAAAAVLAGVVISQRNQRS